MKIIDEYKELTEEIAVINSKIVRTEREIEKLMNTYRPCEIKAIDYGTEVVQSSKVQDSLFFITDSINKLKKELEKLELESKSVTNQREEIEKVINSYGNCKKKIIMRRIKGDTVNEIACEFNYSKAHVRRLSREL